MAKSITTVTSQSWFSRIGQSLSGTLFGLVLFLAAFYLLFWNEGRAVDTHKMLQEGAGIVISIDPQRVDPASEGKLVHLSAKTATADILQDPIFEVEINAIRLVRTVEVLQWQEKATSETRKKLGGGTETITTYTYSKVWSEKLIDTSGFQSSEYENPGTMIFSSQSWQANDVRLGAFQLSQSQIGRISARQFLPLTKDNRLKKQVSGKARLVDGTMYLGSKKLNRIGDYRIKMLVVKLGDISIIAGQSGNRLVPYKTQAEGSIDMLSTGVASAEMMFATAEATNKMLTWLFRFVGLMAMFFGLKLIVRIFSVLADVVPMFGNIVGAGTSIIAFLVALVLSLITIAIAWIFYRPLMAGGLIVVSLGLLWLARSKAGKIAQSVDDVVVDDVAAAEAPQTKQKWGR